MMFLIGGAVIGTWTARIPAIMHGLNLSDAQLSLALVVLAAGGLIGMAGSGRLVDRFGSRPVLTPAALTVGGALVGPAYAPNLIVLLGALLGLGLCHGVLNVAMNASAVECQRSYQRPIMASVHAFFSIGGAVGAATGAAFAHAGRGAEATFLTAGAAATMLAVVAIRWVQMPSATQTIGQPRRHGDTATAARMFPRGRVLLLGLLAFCSLTSEGAAADWGSMYLHDSLGSTSATAAGAYAVFALTMTIGRLTGDRLLARIGPVRLLRVSGLLGSIGFGTGLLLNYPFAALTGFALLGAGLACVVPQVYSAAGSIDEKHSGRGLSYVSALGYLGFVGGPALIGGLTGLMDLAFAMLLLPALMLVIAALATAVRRPSNGRPSSSRVGNADPAESLGRFTHHTPRHAAVAVPAG